VFEYYVKNFKDVIFFVIDTFLQETIDTGNNDLLLLREKILEEKSKLETGDFPLLKKRIDPFSPLEDFKEKEETEVKSFLLQEAPNTLEVLEIYKNKLEVL
jgi:hypothetical protein